VGRYLNNPKYWTIQICKPCGEEFEVYKKEVERGKGKFCIDKDRENNDLSNLEILCPPCHFNNRHEKQRDAEGKFKRSD
jgi:hypothetical protein